MLFHTFSFVPHWVGSDGLHLSFSSSNLLELVDFLNFTPAHEFTVGHENLLQCLTVRFEEPVTQQATRKNTFSKTCFHVKGNRLWWFFRHLRDQ